MGWYHQPCGFKNNTVQVNNKTFCSEKHAKKEKRKLEVQKEKKIAREQRKKEQKYILDTFPNPLRLRIHKKKIVPRKLGDTSSSSSQSEEDDNGKDVFWFHRVLKMHPIDASKPSTYIDN